MLVKGVVDIEVIKHVEVGFNDVGKWRKRREGAKKGLGETEREY